MSIDLYLTQQTAPAPTPTPTPSQNGSYNSGNGQSAAANGFFTTLTGFVQSNENKVVQNLDVLGLDPDAAIKIEEALANIQNILADEDLALGPESDGTGENALLAEIVTIFEELGIDAIPSITDLQTALNELNLEDGELGLAILLINLKPQEITQTKETIAIDLEDEDVVKDITGLSIIKIVDPEENKTLDPEQISAELIDILRRLSERDLTEEIQNEEIITTNINPFFTTVIDQINTGTKPFSGPNAFFGNAYVQNRYSGGDDVDFRAISKSERGESIPQSNQGNAAQDAKSDRALSNALQNNAAVLNGGGFDISGFSSMLNFSYLDGAYSWGQENLLSGLQTALTSTTSLATSLVTQAGSPLAPHPGSQMVAAAMQNIGKGSAAERVLRLQLDPPELGRVEIRMSFDKNNALKATVIAEKPETHLMLQRDVQALERALQDSGVDAGDIQFELAEHGFDFDQHNQRGGGHDEGGKGASETGEELEVIESKMTFHVDPATGYMRYNILA